jgi:hypothetical protein
MQRIFALVASVILLSSCAMPQQTVEKIIDETGAVTSTITTTTAEASEFKEQQVHETLRNRDNNIQKDNAKPSMVMEWQAVEETVFYPGMAAPLTVKKSMPKITVTEKKEYKQPLPIEPSRHPAWASLDNAVNKGTDLTKWLVGMIEGFDYLSDQSKNVGTKYYGDYAPQTAQPFVVDPVIVQ